MGKRKAPQGQEHDPSSSSTHASRSEAQAGARALPPGGDDISEAKVTIHPRITPKTERIGEWLARQRGSKVMTFWAEVVEKGLPVVAALGKPDAEGKFGPWTGEELARELRLVVAQLIEFQIQHHQTPGHLLMRTQLGETQAPAPSSSDSGVRDVLESSEAFAAPTDPSEVEQGFSAMGFGTLSIFEQAEP